MLPTANGVSGVTGRRAATSASPDVPVHIVPSGNWIAAEAPGMPSFARSRPSSRSSAAFINVVALDGRAGWAAGGTPPCEGTGEAADGAEERSGPPEPLGLTAGDAPG